MKQKTNIGKIQNLGYILTEQDFSGGITFIFNILWGQPISFNLVDLNRLERVNSECNGISWVILC